MDQLPVHHRAHSQRQQQAVSLSPTSLAARGEYGEDHMSDKFTEGQDVLARWSDGLFYLGTITKVSVSLGHWHSSMSVLVLILEFHVLKVGLGMWAFWFPLSGLWHMIWALVSVSLLLPGLLCDSVYDHCSVVCVFLLITCRNINHVLFLPSDRSGQTEMLCRFWGQIKVLGPLERYPDWWGL